MDIDNENIIDDNYNNRNINVDIYIDIFKNISYNYDILRIILFNLLNHYSTVQNYYIQYIKFNIYIKKKYKILFDISQKLITTYTVNKTQDKSNLNLPKGTILVIGENNYYRYKTIKLIIKDIINYDKKIYNYLLYLQNHIITLINGMNTFNEFHTYCLKIFFNHANNDNINNMLIRRYNKLKENHITRNINYINNN